MHVGGLVFKSARVWCW